MPIRDVKEHALECVCDSTISGGQFLALVFGQWIGYATRSVSAKRKKSEVLVTVPAVGFFGSGVGVTDCHFTFSEFARRFGEHLDD